MANEVHEGASIQEQLIEACRRNNTDLLEELIASVGSEDELSRLLNDTTTVLGNHLYHEAAAQGHYDVIDILLDQPNFECDPVTRRDGSTPLHLAISWINSTEPENKPFGNELVKMMLEAGSNPRHKNRNGVTPLQLVDPSNKELKELILEHEFTEMNAGDFINAEEAPRGAPPSLPKGGPPPLPGSAAPAVPVGGGDEDEFSGSDEEDRAEWERHHSLPLRPHPRSPQTRSEADAAAQNWVQIAQKHITLLGSTNLPDTCKEAFFQAKMLQGELLWNQKKYGGARRCWTAAREMAVWGDFVDGLRSADEALARKEADGAK